MHKTRKKESSIHIRMSFLFKKKRIGGAVEQNIKKKKFFFSLILYNIDVCMILPMPAKMPKRKKKHQSSNNSLSIFSFIIFICLLTTFSHKISFQFLTFSHKVFICWITCKSLNVVLIINIFFLSIMTNLNLSRS